MWLVVLQLSEAWGVPPWAIMERPGALKWVKRWGFYQEQIKAKREFDKKAAQAKAKLT